MKRLLEASCGRFTLPKIHSRGRYIDFSDSFLKLSENPHELANLLAIRRLIATYMKASELSGRRS
jgi:hypothetical protein